MEFRTRKLCDVCIFCVLFGFLLYRVCGVDVLSSGIGCSAIDLAICSCSLAERYGDAAAGQCRQASIGRARYYVHGQRGIHRLLVCARVSFVSVGVRVSGLPCPPHEPELAREQKEMRLGASTPRLTGERPLLAQRRRLSLRP